MFVSDLVCDCLLFTKASVPADIFCLQHWAAPKEGSPSPPRLRAVTRRSGTAAGRAWKLAAQGSGLAARPGAEAGSAAVSAAGGLVGPNWGGGRRVVGPYGKRSGYSRQFAHNCWNFTLGALKPNPGR